MKKSLVFVFFLNLTITLSELIGGLVSRSYSLISDALHNFQDSLSQLFSLIAIFLNERGKTARYTFGFARYEILAAFVNSVLIFGLSFFMILRGFHRLFNPVEIKLPVLIPVALIGLTANVASVVLLHKHSHESLNIKSTYLHLLSDSLSSVGVVLGALCMWFFKAFWVDGLIAILIGLFILKEASQVVLESLRIFLQVSPFPVDEKQIFDILKDVPGVNGVHHVHVWSLKDGKIHLEAHLEVKDMKISESKEILERVSSILKEKLKVSHITVQMETDVCTSSDC